MARILVVEVDSVRLELVRGVLSGAGHQVLTATNRDSALAAARSSAPDLIMIGVPRPMKLRRTLLAAPDPAP